MLFLIPVAAIAAVAGWKALEARAKKEKMATLRAVAPVVVHTLNLLNVEPTADEIDSLTQSSIRDARRININLASIYILKDVKLPSNKIQELEQLQSATLSVTLKEVLDNPWLVRQPPGVVHVAVENMHHPLVKQMKKLGWRVDIC